MPWKAGLLYAIPALTLHEGAPGHHTQIALAQEQEDQPPFRRFDYISAFGEGWGLYSEKLGVEMDIYETPYEHFGRLTYEMWRACRLVIDTGIHAMGWTRQQAQDFLASNTALSIHEVTTEIDRYISWPAQALSYKLGEYTIWQLRGKAEQRLVRILISGHFMISSWPGLCAAGCSDRRDQSMDRRATVVESSPAGT